MMKIYDSQDNILKEFMPINENEVRMYVCGLTPYERMHVGHVKTYIFFDVVYRYFKYLNFNVNYVQNITDIEDKIFKKALELNVHPLDLTRNVMETVMKEFHQLNILKPTKIVTVSDNIDSIIELINKIQEKGYAYVSEGDVYFSVLKFKDYGTLSKQKIDELKSGIRITEHEKKESPLDFALWKASKENEVVYKSPWGVGRPGWHIECSAISQKYLGETIDIHGGGRDLIFPHHENEKAQSESSTGKRFVNYWMHTGFLTINGEKMSKSLNNFITAGDLIEKYDPNVIRWYLLSRHYRSPIDFAFNFFDEVKIHLDRTTDSIETARVLIDNTEKTEISESIKIEVDEHVKLFHESMQNDFETPTALVHINEIVKILNKTIQSQENHGSLDYVVEKILELTEILGIHIHFKSDDEYLKSLESILKKYELPFHNLNEAVTNLLNKREELRKSKKYVESDEIRDYLKNAHIFVEDLKGKTIWRRG